MYDIECNAIYPGSVYQYKTKNSRNQLLTFKIYEYETGKFNVVFFITTKRKKGYQYKQQTGKDGIRSLIWAKQCLEDWISNCRKTHSGKVLEIYHDDKRRAAVYERYLVPIGFKVARNQYRNLYMIL